MVGIVNVYPARIFTKGASYLFLSFLTLGLGAGIGFLSGGVAYIQYRLLLRARGWVKIHMYGDVPVEDPTPRRDPIGRRPESPPLPRRRITMAEHVRKRTNGLILAFSDFLRSRRSMFGARTTQSDISSFDGGTATSTGGSCSLDRQVSQVYGGGSCAAGASKTISRTLMRYTSGGVSGDLAKAPTLFFSGSSSWGPTTLHVHIGNTMGGTTASRLGGEGRLGRYP